MQHVYAGTWSCVLSLATALGACAQQRPEALNVLVFSATKGYRHDSIEAGVRALHDMAATNRWHIRCTEGAEVFSPAALHEVHVVVFLNTSGDVLNDTQQSALQRYVDAGGGFVGVHAAADTEHDWPWYAELVGARFSAHPPVQLAAITVDESHDSTRGLPRRWMRTDEWYDFSPGVPRQRASPWRVLATVDRAVFAGGEAGQPHPIAWCGEFQNHADDGTQPPPSRRWYTAMGHTSESYAEPLFLEHLRGGIEWAARHRRRR